MDKISVTLTHCNRLDTLQQTIDSFLKTNTYPIDEFIIIDDSNNPICKEHIINTYKEAQIIINPQRTGQKRSLDILFNQCRNEYIFHLEDDWMFDQRNSYMEKSLQILLDNPHIHQVAVRHERDNPHKASISIPNATYNIMDSNFRGIWNGFSWNPGLRRKSDYKRMFPDGFVAFKDEADCAEHTKNFNYKTAILKDTACYHIGYNKHVVDVN